MLPVNTYYTRAHNIPCFYPHFRYLLWKVNFKQNLLQKHLLWQTSRTKIYYFTTDSPSSPDKFFAEFIIGYTRVLCLEPDLLNFIELMNPETEIMESLYKSASLCKLFLSRSDCLFLSVSLSLSLSSLFSLHTHTHTQTNKQTNKVNKHKHTHVDDNVVNQQQETTIAQALLLLKHDINFENSYCTNNSADAASCKCKYHFRK